MNQSRVDFSDSAYQARVEALQGVDEIIEDIVALLEKRTAIDNTYSKPAINCN